MKVYLSQPLLGTVREMTNSSHFHSSSFLVYIHVARNIIQTINFRDLNRFLSKDTWNNKDMIVKEEEVN